MLALLAAEMRVALALTGCTSAAAVSAEQLVRDL
jgi:isopentenyl diphosphate isomerase/L-lactate dehydrogenase-like FMN-dependent dehydrogenase